MDKKTVGIIGGMGPLATADLFRKIVINTKAKCDRDHLHILMDNNPKIPDRTEAILHGGESPIKELVHSAKRLREMGADLIIMPCNTAHCFYDDVQAAVDIPVLHMIKIACAVLKKRGVKKAGLLATDGTLKSGIYQKIFGTEGVELINTETEEQEYIMDLIYRGVKSGCLNYDASFASCVMKKLLDRGAETLVLGCTELPLAKDIYNLKYPTLDPTLALARAAIEAAGGACTDL